MTTLGYGDILPLSSLAQSLVSLEAIVGVLSPTVMIARFVGK
ncbi:ion channel [Endozoicomonas atrinae]